VVEAKTKICLEEKEEEEEEEVEAACLLSAASQHSCAHLQS
jgi:hypothetical protein